MPPDPLQQLLAALAAREDVEVPTTTLGRLRRTAAAGARAGLGALAGRLRGEALALGGLSPQAVAGLVESLGELKGVAMKVGQILSHVDGSLDPQARALLAVLQRHAQPTPFSAIERTLREDLGPRAEAVLATLERVPAATASIGQVHRARREDGTPVAVKVRHPGIDAAIRADFKVAAVGTLLARTLAPGIDVQQFLVEAQARFLEECDYALEASRQQRFARLFAGHPHLHIPAVHPDWCGPRVLTTTWVDGLRLEAFLASAPPAAARERASRALYEFYLGALYRHGLFNADPHPGNLLLGPGGDVTVLDHGCVREFEPEVVAALVALARAVRRDEPRPIQDALTALGAADATRDFDVTRGLLRGFYAPLLVPGRHAIPADRAVALGETASLKKRILRLRLPARLMFLFRIRFGLYAVLAQLGAELDWAALEDELAQPAPARALD